MTTAHRHHRSWTRPVMGTEAGYFDAWLPGGFPPSGPLKGWAAEHAAAHLPGFDHAPGYRVAALARAP